MSRRENITTLEYTYAALFERGESGLYTVTFPDLPGCVTQGTSFQEARASAEDALQSYLTNLQTLRKPIPASREPAGAPVLERITASLQTI